jgi:hypothetical protein
MDKIFVRDVPLYKGDPINTYGKVVFNKIMNKYPKADRSKVIDYVKNITKKKFDSKITFYGLDKNGDSVLKSEPLRNYITSYQKHKKDECLDPTLTVFNKKKPAHLGGMPINNLAERKILKNEAKEYEKQDNMQMFVVKNTGQIAKKTNNNTVSGGTASPGTALTNNVGHNTMTSTTRTLTSMGNIASDNILGGNRYYKTDIDVERHAYSVAAHSDSKLTQAAIDKYRLHIPTDNELLDIIEHSLSRYNPRKTIDRNKFKWILDFTTIERVNFAYHSDFYNFKKYNKDLVVGWLIAMTEDSIIEDIDHLSIMNNLPEYLDMQVRLMHNKDMLGDSRSYSVMYEESPELLKALASTSVRTANGFQWLKEFMDAFLLTDLLPVGAHMVWSMLLDVITLSDTDSTTATQNEFAKAKSNRSDHFSEDDVAVAAVMTTLVAETLGHYIRVISNVMNVRETHASILAYKNEFFFTYMGISSKTKHYIASIRTKEGFTYKKERMEIKGVHLKSSRTMPKYLQIGYDFMDHITKKILGGENFVIEEYLKLADRLEKKTVEMVHSADIGLFRRNQVKDSDSYANEPKDSPYFHIMLWREVFNYKYPIKLETPIVTRSVQLTTDKKAILNSFISNMENRVMADKLDKFLKSVGKDKLGTIQIPEEVMYEYGIPEEIKEIIDSERTVLGALKNFLIPLYTIGAKPVKGYGFIDGHPQIDFDKVPDIYDDIGLTF